MTISAGGSIPWCPAPGWRNGRRGGLKIRWAKARGGSSPPPGTRESLCRATIPGKGFVVTDSLYSIIHARAVARAARGEVETTDNQFAARRRVEKLEQSINNLESPVAAMNEIIVNLRDQVNSVPEGAMPRPSKSPVVRSAVGLTT